MEFITSKILAKLSKPSAIYQTESPFDDYNLDSNTLWTSFSQFQILEKSFLFFSTEEVFSGILFCKSKKTDQKQWFRARFYRLYSDRLVLYSKKNLQTEKRVIVLKGVHLQALEDLLTNDEWDNPSLENVAEKRGFILSRKNDFEIFYTGPIEMHRTWMGYLKQSCILHKFKKKYVIIKNIGKGSRSIVKKVECIENGKFYAVKEMDKTDVGSSFKGHQEQILKVFQTIENEINILRLVNHENTVKLYEVYESRKYVRLVFEFLEGGDLSNKMTNPNFKGFIEEEYKVIINQILLALNALHEKGIMHRDVKPENIFFTDCKNLALKLGDFGFCEFSTKTTHVLTKCGTPGYLAPEILTRQKYDQKCDLFGVGVILFMMITRRSLFWGATRQDVLDQNSNAELYINNSMNVIRKSKASPECKDLMNNLLCLDQEKRCSAKEALSHRWFSSSLISSSNLNNKETPQIRPEFCITTKNENIILHNEETKADTERLYEYNKTSRKYSPPQKNTNVFLSECKKSPRKKRYFGSKNEMKAIEFDGVK